MKITKKQQSKNAISWIENLLSGKFKQGKKKLGDEESGFCCWGLLCYTLRIEYNPYMGWDFGINDYIGFNSCSGFITPYFYGLCDLEGINDSTNAGFKRIAKYLIKHSATNFNSYVSDQIQKHFKVNEKSSKG